MDDLDDLLWDDDRLQEGSNNGLASPLGSTESTRRSLESVRQGCDGLNRHRQALLNRVPDKDTYASFPVNSIEDKDLAYLSAATGDEFALLRGKKVDVLYHGPPLHCHIENSEELMWLLESHKLVLEVHSHPDFDRISPSFDDRNFLRAIGQKESRIISSYTAEIITFSADWYDDL